MVKFTRMEMDGSYAALLKIAGRDFRVCFVSFISKDSLNEFTELLSCEELQKGARKRRRRKERARGGIHKIIQGIAKL